MDNGNARRLRVQVLVIADEEPAVLHVKHADDDRWTLPGGDVPANASIVGTASELLAAQTGIRRPVMPGLAFDQCRADPVTGTPETLTYVLAGGIAQEDEVTTSDTTKWIDVRELLHTPGITKYAITSALYTGKAFTLLLDGEGLYTDGIRTATALLKGATTP